jgi:MscS family membrane protein
MRYAAASSVLCLVLGLASSAQAQELDAGVEADGGVPEVDLSTPRSTMRSFVFSMQRANDDQPSLISDAVRCLDVDWLETEEGGGSRATQLAAKLFEVLGVLGIAVEEVPDTSKKATVTLWEGSAADPSTKKLAVELVRQDQQWRFSRRTLEQLDDIREAAKRPSSEGDDTSLQVHRGLRSPRATMKTFLRAMNADPPNIDRAADCLEPPEDAGPAWDVVRHDHAYRLYSVLLRVRTPVLSDLPEDPEGTRFTWYVHEDGRIVLARMQKDDSEKGIWHGQWRFSGSTLAVLEDLYRANAFDPILPEAEELGYVERLSLGLRVERAVPAVLRSEALGLALWKWFGIVILLIFAGVAFVAGAVGARLLYPPLTRIWRIDTPPEDAGRMTRTIGGLVMLYALYRAIAADVLLLPPGLLSFLYPFSRAMVLVALAVVGLRTVQILEHHYERSDHQERLRVAGLLLPLLESFFRLLVGAILIAFFLRLLGFSQAAVLGGLGLLGAAVGLAAQGSLSNIVAAISIVYDRPFRAGDWVNLDGLDATVERLGLVSVRLRTFYNSLLVVPNSQIVSKAVDNYGERRYRRLRHFLRLRYDTPAAKIDALCEGLRELVRLHPYTRKDYYHIYLNELTPSSANVLIYVFFDVPDWATELRERHRFLIDALSLVEAMGIELAYPTQRLLVEQSGEEPDAEAVDFRDSPEDEGIRRANRLFADTYGDPPKERGPVIIEEGPLVAGFDDDGGQGDGN